MVPACIDDIQGASVVDLEVQLLRMERAHCRRDMPNTVSALADAEDGVLVTDVTDDILHCGVIPCTCGVGHNVEGDHTMRAALHQHFDQALPNEAGATSDNTHARYRGE